MKVRMLLLASALLIGIAGLVPVGRHARVSSHGASTETVAARYHEIPKGVVLEGSAEGIEELTSLTFDKEKNEFTINEKYKYFNPIGRKEFAQIFKAIKEDDRIGVTLLEGQIKTYGKLGSGSDIIAAMSQTDKILGGVIYGLDHLLDGVKLPNDYKPKKAADRKIPVVAFSNFTRFIFHKSIDRYSRIGCSLDVTLIPLSEKKSETGGHMPDESKMKEYVVEESDRANLDHLRSHQNQYFELPSFAKTVAAGEAAAFARFVRDSEKIDGEALLKSMK